MNDEVRTARAEVAALRSTLQEISRIYDRFRAAIAQPCATRTRQPDGSYQICATCYALGHTCSECLARGDEMAAVSRWSPLGVDLPPQQSLVGSLRAELWRAWEEIERLRTRPLDQTCDEETHAAQECYRCGRTNVSWCSVSPRPGEGDGWRILCSRCIDRDRDELDRLSALERLANSGLAPLPVPAAVYNFPCQRCGVGVSGRSGWQGLVRCPACGEENHVDFR